MENTTMVYDKEFKNYLTAYDNNILNENFRRIVEIKQCFWQDVYNASRILKGNINVIGTMRHINKFIKWARDNKITPNDYLVKKLKEKG